MQEERLALPEEVLLKVDKAARYIGNELNCVIKDPDTVSIRFAFCFPDVYEIGMSHLGIQILYDMFNHRDDVWCERVYSPWPDLTEIMKEQSIPLFALESQDPLRGFDFLGFTLQYEMCYTNVLQVLDLAKIPFHASERTDEDPIVIGGGPCTYNPEPLADFFDMFYIGEGETSYDKIFDLYKTVPDRREFLRAAASIPGIYVPGLYTPHYNDDGTLSAFVPEYPDVPAVVERQVVTDLDSVSYPKRPIVPFVQAAQEKITLEIMRGCIRGCRFCQAGMIYRPNREKSLETLKAYADEMIDSTGMDELTLSSLSSSDYSELGELVEHLMEVCEKKKVNISLPSLRIDAFSLDVMEKIQDIKKSSVTFAPEAGSQRMRNVINKGLTEDDILGGAQKAFEGGWNKVKLYFMLGLPGEREEDIIAIPRLANDIAALYYDTVPREKRHGRCQINISTSFFVPKPFTPFQWAKMEYPREYIRRAHELKDEMRRQLNQKSLHYQWHEADVTILEGVFARGDRRIGAVIEEAYRRGAMFDAWSEFFSMDIWKASFDACGVDMDFYTMRERSTDELLPWDFIDAKVSRAFLIREWERAGNEEVTLNCRESCGGCGSAVFGCGVCPSAGRE